MGPTRDKTWPAKAGDQPEPSVARRRATAGVKRTQGVSGLRYRTPKVSHRGGRRVRTRGRLHRAAVCDGTGAGLRPRAKAWDTSHRTLRPKPRPGGSTPPGSTERSTPQGVPQEPGRPRALRIARCGTSERGQPERGRMGLGESEPLRSTAETGEPARWDPAEGREWSEARNRRGER